MNRPLVKRGTGEMEWYLNAIEIVVFSWPGLEAQKSGLAEAVNRPNLTFAVSPKYLSDETEIHILITRIPRVVYRFFWDFSNISFFPSLVDTYRYPLLNCIPSPSICFFPYYRLFCFFNSKASDNSNFVRFPFKVRVIGSCCSWLIDVQKTWV